MRTTESYHTGPGWMTATEQAAWSTRAWLVEPSSSPVKPPRPRQPTTSELLGLLPAMVLLLRLRIRYVLVVRTKTFMILTAMVRPAFA